MDDFRALFDDLAVDESVRDELHALTPETYTGVGDDLVDEL
jgi:adenylosuccinate lyase